LSAAGGDLHEYLEGMAGAENMVKYVEQHPFGQERITETNESWEFYLNVINSLCACQPENWKHGCIFDAPFWVMFFSFWITCTRAEEICRKNFINWFARLFCDYISIYIVPKLNSYVM